MAIETFDTLFDTAKGREKVLRRFSVFDGAGIDLRGCDTLEGALEKAEIDYGGQKEPIFLENGTKIEDMFCVTKTTDGSPLGIVGKDYSPVHNKEAFGVAGTFAEDFGFQFEAGGANKGANNKMDCSKSFLVLRGDDVRIGAGNGDIFNTFAVFRNSFDGSGGIQYRVLLQRLCCLNGMTRFLGGKKNQLWINVQHSSNVKDRLEIANNMILDYTNEIEHIRNEASAFIDTHLTRKEFEREVIPTLLKAMRVNTEDERDANLRKVTNIVQKALSAYDAEDTQMYNGTAYKAILALTDFESHMDPLRDTKNPSIYMNRALSGMVWTTAVATYLAQSRHIKIYG